MIPIDGSFGEGGGQVLRSALALSLVTGRSFALRNIRASRRKPGLGRQHLTAVQAARRIGNARVRGAEPGSRELDFEPRGVRPGDHEFAVGTAGSANLVLQAVLPALLLADGPTRLAIEGGTHNMHAPPSDFLERTFLPLVQRMGPEVALRLERHGFYPAGGGRLQVSVRPAARLASLDLVERGEVVRRRITALVSRLPVSIGHREVETARGILGWDRDTTEVREVDSPGPGNVVMIEVGGDRVSELFTGFGRKGVPAERVAEDPARAALRYLESGAPAGVPVGTHLADQLIVPFALAGGGRFRTLRPTLHTTTNIEVVKRFLEVAIRVERAGEHAWEIAFSA